MPTAKLKLVTVIASFELQDRVVAALRASGASGYTLVAADGRGKTGQRRHGMFEPGNARIECLMSAKAAATLLERIAPEAEEFGFIAFAVDAEAVPAKRFAKDKG